MAQMSPDKLSFKKHDSIGANDAADDKEYLLNCFIDLGDLELLKDFSNKRCILLGRTGAGKTALATKLQEDKEDRVIIVDPEALAMQHISNSTIIRFLSELNIDLNTFFKLLWRHEICVEIFTKHIKVTSETDHNNFVENVKYKFKKRNPKHLKALEYLERWKDSFWKTSDSHVVEMISKTESEVSSAVGSSPSILNAKIQGKNKLSEEEKTEIKQFGQSIVNDVQMKEVAGLLDMLNDFIEFHQKKYYVVIDKLDEKWVGNEIRYQLIKSLIETVRDLNRLSNIKPVVVLRYDLLGRVFDITKDTGFQEEKYRPLYLDIRWSKAQLIDLIDSRINYLLSARYSKRKKLTYHDILPQNTNGVPTIDYIIGRTLMRPRDIIEYINLCIEEVSVEKGIITEDVILDVETRYSQSRFDALAYEWFMDYPGLREWTSVLKNRPQEFTFSEFNNDEILEKCLNYAVNPARTDVDSSDLLHDLCLDVSNNKLESSSFIQKLILIFYRLGLIGLKRSEDKKTQWSQSIRIMPQEENIDDNTIIMIHPCYTKVLMTKGAIRIWNQ